MSTQFNRRRSGMHFALIALALICLPFTLAAFQHNPAPPVMDSTVDQPNAHVDGQLPIKGEVQENRQKIDTGQQKDPCTGMGTVAEEATGPRRTEIVYKIDKLMENPDEYLGKTVTVDGIMHRQFTDQVFTIENDGMWNKDILVISLSPMSDSVIPLQDSYDQGKKVRVTGVVRPYDYQKLECLFGPLHTESRAGHSFTKNPVLIIGYRPPATPAAVIAQ
jgi:hypothetical protein